MPNSAQIRKIPNHFLYQLELEYDGPKAEPTLLPHNVLIRATLTDEAKRLGVRFDQTQEDDIFDLSAGIGHNNGHYSWGGIHFQRGAKNICLEVHSSKQRLLRADLSDSMGNFNENMPFNLDEHIGLVDYFHPLKNETYFRLGLKLKPIKEVSSKNYSKAAYSHLPFSEA